MREEAILRFMEALGIDRIRMSSERGWVNAPCPLAPYTHAGGADTRPSFGITIDDEAQSVYWCFGCSPRGHRLDWLLHSLFVAERRYPYEAARIFALEELAGLPEDDDETSLAVPDRWVARAPKQVEPLPPKVLKKFPLLQGRSDYEARRVRAWLEVDRKIPEWAQNLYRLRYHYDNQSVIFPLTDVRGNTFLLRERLRKEKRIWTVNPELAGFPDMDFPKLKEVGAWFGMLLIDWTAPVILVEGEIDVMRLAALGFMNAIGSATSSVTDAQIDALTAHTIILGYDADKAGNFARSRVIDRMKSKATLFDANWENATRSDGRPCKDAGDLPDRDQLAEVMDNLEPV
jgi:5S rRNA maturation endonuclease (ribonuclease M5)